MNSKENSGQLGEAQFKLDLIKNGVEFKHVNKWCDFIINGYPVEVKTCRLSHKFSCKSKNQQYKIGRYEFTDIQRKKMFYCAFYVRHEQQLLFLGIAMMKENKSKYLSIHQTRNLDLMSLEEFKRVIHN